MFKALASGPLRSAPGILIAASRMALNTKINTYHASLVAGLLAKLKATPEGDGNMLDHALMLYGAGLGNGDQHSPRDLPLVVLGGANGQHVGRGHRQVECKLGRDVAIGKAPNPVGAEEPAQATSACCTGAPCGPSSGRTSCAPWPAGRGSGSRPS